MKQGIYEQLISKLVSGQINQLNEEEFYTKLSELDLAESSKVLSNYIQQVVEEALSSVAGPKAELLERRISIVNRLVLKLKSELDSITFEEHLLDSKQVLKAVFSNKLGISNFDQHLKNITPYTRINQSELFTGGRAGVELGSEIRKEILSSDRIDFLVSFIKWKGIRIFENELHEFVERGGKLRVITTTYMGTSPPRPLYSRTNPNSICPINIRKEIF